MLSFSFYNYMNKHIYCELKTENTLLITYFLHPPRHILPESMMFSAPNGNSVERTRWFEKSLMKDKPIFLYLHGNRLSRAAYYRVELYRLLRSQDYHVIAMDYRGLWGRFRLKGRRRKVFTELIIVNVNFYET